MESGNCPPSCAACCRSRQSVWLVPGSINGGPKVTSLHPIDAISNGREPVVSSHACMKILFVSSTNEFGGAERHLLDLIRRIREPGVQLSILCLGDDFFTERLDPSQAVRVISWKKIPKSLWDWLDLFRIFRTDAVVFIYSWFWCL